MNQRIFSNYYRVAFYGKPFKDMDGKEYIYKELNTARVAEVAENLKVIKLFNNLVRSGN
jgi:hypothetical protein